MPFDHKLDRAHLSTIVLMLGLLAIGGCNDDVDVNRRKADAGTIAAKEAPPRAAARIFISGHSLTAPPIPHYMASIADSLGTPMAWNQQHVFGSTIKERTRGRDGAAGVWPGYNQGINRDGQGLNVVAELRQPTTVEGGPYDALIITEQHTLLGSLLWNDTVRYLRHFHERLIEGNAQATTYFYHSWISLDDKNDPRRWIAYERGAAELWDCVAVRVNYSLAAEGRTDRIVALPAATALADLVERATQGPGLPPVSASSVRKTMDRLFTDNVHLTTLGAYYAALVSYGTVYRRSPEGAWFPPDVAPGEARALQQAAWASLRGYWRRSEPRSLKTCRSHLLNSFIDTYATYVRDAMEETGPLKAYARWVRNVASWRYRFSRDDASNPLYYNEASDRSYWYPAPPP